jgi:hypothetical protein
MEEPEISNPIENDVKIENEGGELRVDDFLDRWVVPGFSTGVYFLMLFCLNHFVFWGVEQMHYRWCTGSGLYGFFQSMLTNQSGICTTFRTVSGMASSSSTQVLYTVIATIAAKLYQSKHKSLVSATQSSQKQQSKL